MSPKNPSVLITYADIQKRVGELAPEISAWLETDTDADAPLVLWLAEGALYFAADLTRNIKCDPLEIRSLTENRGADVVIEASGSVAALQNAIRTVGFQGRVLSR